MGIASGNTFAEGPDDSSPGGLVWIDGTGLASEILMRKSEQYPTTETPKPEETPQSGGYAAGDTRTFTCVDFHREEDFTINATCEAVGEYCYIFVEAGQTMPRRETEALADAFDTAIFPMDTEVFGNAPNEDGDPHIFLLMSDIRDEEYYNNSTRYVIGGYFSKRVENGIEIIVIDLEADPSEINETIAHEFQHLIHHYCDPGELKWIDEGCSMYAEFVCLGKKQQDAVWHYMRQPDTPLIVADYRFNHDDENNAHYGASYLWTLYLSENFGDLSNRPGHERFIRDLVNSSDTGIQGIDATLALHGYDERFDDIFKQWVVANYLESEGEDPPRGYASIHYPKPPSIAGHIDLEELDGSTYSFPEINMHSWSTAYYKVETDDPERVAFANDQGFWNTSFTDKNGDVIIVISPLNEGGVVTLTVTREPEERIVDFTANVTRGSAPLAVQFTDTSSGNITARLWDFGDTETSLEQNPIHTCSKAGMYIVNLTVTTASGMTENEEKEGYITVKPAREKTAIYEDYRIVAPE